MIEAIAKKVKEVLHIGMYTISKEFHFSAAHVLEHLPDGHPCARLHGHNYIVVVELEGADLNDDDFIVDYGELSVLKDWIDEHLDHKNLNDVLPCRTTAENIAKYLFWFCKNKWKQTKAVRVSETPKTWASYEGVV